ncbi:hypothetical protein DdX_15932 [Ditylenchus destructor]|uniref:Uncharacterized protein n=1 Tax=Ditylenchus destructor TaxID=166010 RepID=A0AAD4MUF4_9BILA|nr:hypothetical protein DdX_15932 [Ditylenchus destructor]
MTSDTHENIVLTFHQNAENALSGGGQIEGVGVSGSGHLTPDGGAEITLHPGQHSTESSDCEYVPPGLNCSRPNCTLKLRRDGLDLRGSGQLKGHVVMGNGRVLPDGGIKLSLHSVWSQSTPFIPVI